MEPTNRELQIKLDNVTQKFEEKHVDVMEKLTEISELQKEQLKEAKYTNGKVANLIWWRNGLVWAIGFLGSIIVIGTPIGYMILRYVVLNEIRVNTEGVALKISQQVVDEAFKNYKGIVEIHE